MNRNEIVDGSGALPLTEKMIVPEGFLFHGPRVSTAIERSQALEANSIKERS